MDEPVFSIEQLQVQWMRQHNEAHTGKHWKADVHRRYAIAKHNHKCGETCDKRSPLDVLKKTFRS